ncbi:AIR synthase-related protein [Streptomyces sp. NPDC058308]|uniref:AIR synthase-related protein n=1 Tax=Streptomyces sp. NPDC058308 TaxID=3346440 RepID=UPI0036E9D0E0
MSLVTSSSAPAAASLGTAQVGLADDGEGGAGSLRWFLRDALGDVCGPCPGLGGGVPVLRAGAHVVDPPFYGDGDIGHAAVCATVNELAAAGAVPLGLALSAVVEAGLALERVRQVARSVRAAAQAAGVVVVDVDARVVRAGEADQIYLHTTGIGLLRSPAPVARARAGDRLVVSAPLGGFGAHVLSVRARLGHESVISGGCVPLTGLLGRVREAVPAGAVRAVRAVGRGGLAAVLRAYADETGLGLRVREAALPVQYEARVALDMLEVDPLEAATTSCVCVVVAAEAVDALLAVVRAHPCGQEAAVVGEVVGPGADPVVLVPGDGRPAAPAAAARSAPARLA